MRIRSRYALEAVLVYVALGVAIGMVGWALLIHDGSGGAAAGAGAPAQQGPARGDSQR